MLLKHGNKKELFSQINNHILYFFSGINFNDVLVRYGLLEDTPRPPFIPGFECSGEVLDIGTNVTHVEVSLESYSNM